MNQWSRRRKRIILSIIVFVLVVVIGAPVFFLFYRAPTCFDNSQNGDEKGVDCGGSCQLLCTTESLPLVFKGDPRVLKIADNTFEVVALIENTNISGEISRAGYAIKLYDLKSVIPIRIIEGEIYVPKASTFAIFEGPFILEAEVTPARAVLEWKKESLVWRNNIRRTPKLTAQDISFSREDTSPRLDATIENPSLENVSNIDLVALIFSETGNIFAASRTFIDTLPAGGMAPIVFTWPKPFSEKPLNVNIIIRILPDRSFIQ